MTAGCPRGRQGFVPKQLSCVLLRSTDSMFKSVKSPTQCRFPVHFFFFSKKCKRCFQCRILEVPLLFFIVHRWERGVLPAGCFSWNAVGCAAAVRVPAVPPGGFGIHKCPAAAPDSNAGFFLKPR